MDEREFKNEYKRVFNNIHASGELLEKIKTQKQPKRNLKPYIAAAASAAAAFMIFAAVHDYDFNSNDDGVINETRIAETEKPTATEKAKPQTEQAKSVMEDDAKSGTVSENNVSATNKPEQKTTQDYMKEALEKSGATKQSEYKAPVITSKPDNSNSADSTKSGSSYSAGSIPEKTPAAEVESNAVSEQSNSYYETSAPEYKASAELKINKAAETSERTTKFFNNPEETAVAEAAPDAAYSAASGGSVSGGAVSNGSAGGSGSAMMPGAGGGGAALAVPSSVDTSVEWDNDRYFEYIGVNLKEKIELCADVEYTGDDTAYFMVDRNGDLLNDLRIFTFRGENGICINIETTRSVDYVQSRIDDESFEKSDIAGTSAVVIDMDGTYRCYMIFNGTAYTIDVSGFTEDGLCDILLSIVS